ncbi:TetR/AcrR family transcriptional regulator [Streptomyces acidicola]|uniref:TetR/AcrR family transcriptional regulator n=1 Tax=Streptomyces acidicola TaxID=2596892 RepID=UPI0038185351
MARVARAGNNRMRYPASERREQILTAAAEAFAATGFQGTSLAEVAARVGVSQPGLLHHFGSKEALYLAVLEQRDQESDRVLDAEMAGVETTTRRWLMAHCRRNERQPGLIRLFTMQSAESLDPAHPAHAFFQERNLRIRGHIAQLIAADQAKDILSATLDADATALELIALMNGLQLQWLRDRSVDMCAVLDTSLHRLENLPTSPAPANSG